MGRIAEALKRAQEERARRMSKESAADPDKTAFAGSVAFTERTVPVERDVLSQASILDVPTSYKSFAVQTAPIPAEKVSPEAVALHEPASQVAERYRAARTRLLTGNPEYRPRIFAVTSSLHREGKTVTAANLGYTIAELRYLQVALIDMDFRRRGLSYLFGAADQPGIAEVLKGEKTLVEVCIQAARENLYFIPTGELGKSNLTELFTGGRSLALAKELRERFHYTLLDTPPVNTVADVGLIAPMCHSVILVVRLNFAPEPVVQQSVKTLQANNINIAGGILLGKPSRLALYNSPNELGIVA